MDVIRRYRSQVDSVAFPALHQIKGALLLATMKQLDESQWWPVEQLHQAQLEQLGILIRHAVATVPYYQQKLAGIDINSIHQWGKEQFAAIPVLKRTTLQDQYENLRSQNLPESHGQLHLMQSSGSTGRPVQVLGSELTRFYWNAATLRDNYWHQHDFMQKFAAVRPDRGDKEQTRTMCKGWGPPVDWIYPSAPTMIINSRVDISQQLEWLHEYQPVYLLSLPSNLRALLQFSEEKGIKLPGLQQVRCFGENVSMALREHVKSLWGVGVTDIYSSQEVGYMALQCPEHEHYHVQSETMYLEVLDDNDRPCAPGEIGRVVVTSLHNFAMPLLRYEVGDYAEVGEPCACGRGLPVLKRIVGRSRNMVHTPDGKCYWPSFPVEYWMSIADVRQFQLRQKTLEHIEMLVVMDGQLTKQQEEKLTKKLHSSLNYPFKLTYHCVESIPVQKNGKYEDFISEL